MIWGLTIIGLAAATYIIGCLRTQNIVHTIVQGICIHYIIYILASGILLWMDRYSVMVGLIGAALMEGIAILILSVRKRRFTFQFDYKEILIPVILLCVAAPFAYKQFEFFGMGQDQGVYQTKAILYMNGEYSNRYDFEEYHSMDEAHAEEFREFIGRMNGYNLKTIYPTFQKESQHCDVEGYFHGIPTIAAVLAWSGALFGLSGMMRLHFILFLCIVWLFYAACQRLKLSKGTGIIATGIIALSPMILWASKSALTEISLVMFVTLFFYYILGSDDPSDIWLSVLPVWGFAFYHVSCFEYIPLFVCVYFIRYLLDQRIRDMIGAYLITVGLCVGFVMMLYVAPQYSYDNLSRMLIHGMSNQYLIFYPFAMLMAVILISILVIKLCPYLRKIDYKKKVFAWLIRLMLLLVFARYAVKLAKAIRESFYGVWEGAWNLAPYSALSAILYFTGIFAFLSALVYLLWKPMDILKEDGMITAFGCYYYLLLFAVVSPMIIYYYYYTRYLTFSIPCVMLFTAYVLDRYHPAVKYVVGILSIVCVLPFSTELAIQTDDSRLEWDTLEHMAAAIEEQSAIVFVSRGGEDITKIAAIALKGMTDGYIFPAEEDLDAQTAYLDQTYEHIYYVADQEIEAEYPILLQETYLESQDDLHRYFKWSPLPTKMMNCQKNVIIYEAK